MTHETNPQDKPGVAESTPTSRTASPPSDTPPNPSDAAQAIRDKLVGLGWQKWPWPDSEPGEPWFRGNGYGGCIHARIIGDELHVLRDGDDDDFRAGDVLTVETLRDAIGALEERREWEQNIREGRPVEPHLVPPRRPRWLVPGFIERGAYVQVFGPPTSGKTYLAIDTAYRVGREHGVLYVIGEGPDFPARCGAWYETNAAEEWPDVNMLPAMDLTADGAAERIIAHLEAMDSKPALLILDTVSHCVPDGVDSAGPAGRLVATCTAIRDATGVAILQIHHPGHTRQHRSAGSFQIAAALDADFQASRSGSTVTLKATKDRAGHLDAVRQWELRYVATQDATGREVRGTVADPVAAQVDDGDDAGGRQDVEDGEDGEEANQTSKTPRRKLSANQSAALEVGKMLLHDSDGEPVPMADYRKAVEARMTSKRARASASEAVKAITQKGLIEADKEYLYAIA